MNEQNRNRAIDIKNKLMVVKEEVRDGNKNKYIKI